MLLLPPRYPSRLSYRCVLLNAPLGPSLSFRIDPDQVTLLREARQLLSYAAKNSTLSHSAVQRVEQELSVEMTAQLVRLSNALAYHGALAEKHKSLLSLMSARNIQIVRPDAYVSNRFSHLLEELFHHFRNTTTYSCSHCTRYSRASQLSRFFQPPLSCYKLTLPYSEK